MKVLVQGSKEFEDYSVFMRSMAVALSSLKGDEDRLEIYSIGPKNINGFVTGFVNLSEDGMRARGMSIRKYMVPHRWVEDNMDSIDYFIYLTTPGERDSRLAALADEAGVEVGVFRY